MSQPSLPPAPQNAAQQRAHKVLAQRELARRRLLQFTKLTHPSYEAGWVHEDICARLEKFSQDVKDRKSPRLMLLMPPRHGKLMADSTEVRTREGWKTHGQLRVGDFVVGYDGRWTRVAGVSPPAVADVLVTIDTGESFLVHENHEWDCLVMRASPNIIKYGNRKYYEYRTLETKEMLEWKARVGSLRYRSLKYAYRFSLPPADLANNLDIIKDVRARLTRQTNGARGNTRIMDVRRVAPEDAQLGRCIQVEAADGLYLVGRSLVPTHNSELASIRFPAWHLGHNPSHEIINVGYNLDLPMKFSRKVREVVRDGHYMAMFPDTRLDPDSQSAEAWNTTKGGGFTAAGVGGGITGKGAHILIIDDPLKNMEEADSIDRRDLLDDWYQSTAYTRLAPGGGVLFIETWWNDDDLAGRLQQRMANDKETDQFDVVRYPALSEKWEYRDEDTKHIARFDEPWDKDNPPLGYGTNLTLLRPTDTCLHEARYPTEALKRIRSNMNSPRIWSALYQQNPVPDEGMYFRKEFFRYQRVLPAIGGYQLFTAWDFAIGEKQQNDWTVGVTLLQDHTDTLYLMDVERFRGDSMQIVESILDVAVKWGSDPTTDYMLGVEDGQIWRAIEPLLKKRMNERKQYLSYEALKPLTDKMARARPLQGRMQQGKVIFPEESSWLKQAEQELLRFPAGAHDDVVDALSWAVRLCIGREPPARDEVVQPKSWKDRISVESGDYDAGHMSA